jgi:hypothetical protein
VVVVFGKQENTYPLRRIHKKCQTNAKNAKKHPKKRPKKRPKNAQKLPKNFVSAFYTYFRREQEKREHTLKNRLSTSNK